MNRWTLRPAPYLRALFLLAFGCSVLLAGEKPATRPDGKTGDGEREDEDFASQFLKKDVPPRSEAEMKAFLTKRLEDLKAIGGTWRLKETKHFCCFSNVPEAKHAVLCQWNEDLYDRLCQVLRHKEGDKLWNNKMPIYYFEAFAQFQKFTVEIDRSPGSAMSGGYFSANGREVHICIPFMSERFRTDVKSQDRMARATLHHEGTHAFLQLSGESVPLNRWLHEGLAQFVEFWYDPQNNPARNQRVGFLQQCILRNSVPSWESMRNRPMGGMDVEGYAFAWAKLEFLYRSFSDNQKLPQMIRLVKAGKSEDEAMASAFGFPVDKLEEGYKQWVKVQGKRGFNFGQ
ncbi:MAG: hypothetical protein NTW87_04590 [Planctomycetota bacterium]|nr:hypothetical protein [Planctomycetota bacterium]